LKEGGVVRADENYIRESIYNPSAKIVAGHADIMPSFTGQVSELDVIAITAYLQTLKAGQTPNRVEVFPPPTGTPSIRTEGVQP
jgi:cytochrome c oxidase subunit 2